jgi:hypothetical protein
VKLLETAIVVGALGALAYYVYRRTQPTSLPVGQLLGRVAWLQSDPIGWIGFDPADDDSEETAT